MSGRSAYVRKQNIEQANTRAYKEYSDFADIDDLAIQYIRREQALSQAVLSRLRTLPFHSHGEQNLILDTPTMLQNILSTPKGAYRICSVKS